MTTPVAFSQGHWLLDVQGRNISRGITTCAPTQCAAAIPRAPRPWPPLHRRGRADVIGFAKVRRKFRVLQSDALSLERADDAEIDRFSTIRLCQLRITQHIANQTELCPTSKWRVCVAWLSRLRCPILPPSLHSFSSPVCLMPHAWLSFGLFYQ